MTQIIIQVAGRRHALNGILVASRMVLMIGNGGAARAPIALCGLVRGAFHDWIVIIDMAEQLQDAEHVSIIN